jgi:hypothetical protein
MVAPQTEFPSPKSGRLVAGGAGQPVAVASALVCTLTLYWVIGSYEPRVTDYHLDVSNTLFLFSALLLLPVLSGCGGWGNSHGLASWRYWLAFWAALCIATLFAPSGTSGVAHLRLYFAVFNFGLAIRIWFLHAGDQVREFALLGIVFVHMAILLLVFMAFNRLEPGSNGGGAWLPFHGNIRHVAYHGMVAACLGYALGILGGRFRLFGYAGALSALFGIAFFGSRGALLGWLSFVGAAVYFLPDKARAIKIALVLLVLSVASAMVADKYWRHSLYGGGVVSRMQVQTAAADGRIEIWARAAVAALDAPLIGYGPDGYRTSQCCSRHNVQPHNSILQVLLESGLLGLGAAVMLIWRSFRRPVAELLRIRSSEDIDRTQALLVSILFGFFVYSLVDGLFFHVVPLVLFAIIAGLFFASSSQRRTDTNAPPKGGTKGTGGGQSATGPWS